MKTVQGVIEATLPGGLYRVRTDTGDALTVSLGTAARRVTVKLIPGDRVTVERSTLDPNRGRITQKQR
jgi:translation initiation factor IF-1